LLLVYYRVFPLIAYAQPNLERRLVQAVDRPNIGLCLDTFQTAGSEWADPTTPSGLVENAGSREELEQRFKASVEKLPTTIPQEMIYLLQITDVYKPSTPLENKSRIKKMRAASGHVGDGAMISDPSCSMEATCPLWT
jgi:hypothetical protein